jgi:hypothetical protein
MTSIFVDLYPNNRDREQSFFFLNEVHDRMIQLLELGEFPFSRMKFCFLNRCWFLQAGYQYLGNFYEIQLEDHQAFAINNAKAYSYQTPYILSFQEKQRGREVLGDDESSPNWDNNIELQFVKEPHHKALQWILYQGSHYWILDTEQIASIFL